MSEIRQLAADVAKIQTDLAVMRTHLEYVRDVLPADRLAHRELARRVNSLEAWRWRLIGGAVAAGALGGPAVDALWSAVIRS